MVAKENIKSFQAETLTALLNKCKTGDQKAQLQVYRQYAQAMFNTSCAILDNKSDAEECTQEAFLRAFQSLNQFRADATFGAWLKKITINECLRKQRKLQLDFEHLDEGYHENEEASDNEVPYSMQQVKLALSKLPSGYRVVLQLYLLEGYDHEEIGQILEMKSATSRSQFLRGKKKLIKILNDTPHE
mgnify:CR=1 FL=1